MIDPSRTLLEELEGRLSPPDEGMKTSLARRSNLVRLESGFAFSHCSQQESKRRIDVKGSSVIWENKPALLLLLDDVTDEIEKLRLRKFQQFRQKMVNSQSHNLKTPLNGLMMLAQDGINRAAELCSGSKNPELAAAAGDFKDLLEDIKRLGIFQTEQVRQVLQFQKSEDDENGNEIPLNPVLFTVERLTSSVAFLFKKQSEMAGVALEMQIENRHVELFNDFSLIESVVISLVETAFKYSRRNSKIVLRVRSHDLPYRDEVNKESSFEVD